MPSSTALLIFAQSASSDAARKRVATHPTANRRVMELLNERTRLVAEATGLSVIHSTTLIPHKGAFGCQLTGAVQATFALGYERIIIIGNDCPALTSASLMQAADRLKTEPVVLGADRRGGLYLLGLSRELFETVSLANLPWQTQQLAQSVCQLFSNEAIGFMPRLADVNYLADLRHYQSATAEVALFIMVLLARETGEPIRVGYAARLVRLYGRTRSLRAPPTSCARLTAA